MPFFKITSEHQTQCDKSSFDQQQYQPTFDSNNYPTVYVNDSSNVNQSQEETQTFNHHPTSHQYIATSNEIPGVDTSSNYYQPLQQDDIHSNDSQPQIQPLSLNNKEQFPNELLSQATITDTYDYYSQNTSSHPSYEVS